MSLQATNTVATDTQTLTIDITAIPITPGASTSTLDSDGDGFPDELEIAAGSSPFDSKSTPIGNAPAQIMGMSNVKLKIALNFAKKGSDSISLSGALTLPSDFGQSGKLVYFDVGGVIRRFALDANGASKIGSDSARFKLSLAGATGAGISKIGKVVAFTLSIKNADASPLLVDEGLTSIVQSNVPKTVPVLVMMNTSLYKISQSQLYTSTGKTGKSKNP